MKKEETRDYKLTGYIAGAHWKGNSHFMNEDGVVLCGAKSKLGFDASIKVNFRSSEDFDHDQGISAYDKRYGVYYHKNHLPLKCYITCLNCQKKIKHIIEYHTNANSECDFVEIPLTKGYVAVIDKIDIDRVSKHKWCASVQPDGKRVYAYSWMDGKNVAMHRFILGADLKTSHIDHKDRDTLNNRRSNLRPCDARQNRVNTPPENGKLKGVRLSVEKNWQVHASKDGKKISLGTYKDRNDAIRVYNDFVKKEYGEFAYLNKIDNE